MEPRRLASRCVPHLSNLRRAAARVGEVCASALGILLLVALLLSATGCAVYRADRTWIPEQKCEEARKVYDQTGSLALTEKVLRESDNWQRAEMNEAIYRLKKEHNLESAE